MTGQTAVLDLGDASGIPACVTSAGPRTADGFPGEAAAVLDIRAA